MSSWGFWLVFHRFHITKLFDITTFEYVEYICFDSILLLNCDNFALRSVVNTLIFHYAFRNGERWTGRMTRETKWKFSVCLQHITHKCSRYVTLSDGCSSPVLAHPCEYVPELHTKNCATFRIHSLLNKYISKPNGKYEMYNGFRNRAMKIYAIIITSLTSCAG